jgi:hypothetical protein
MDPNATLQELRELYNEVVQDEGTDVDAAYVLDLFDALDNWIIAGGFLPNEWRR